MNAGDIIAKVQSIVDEDSFSSDDILALLNECVLDIAGGGEREHGYAKIAPLPDLFANWTVNTDTDASSVSMPGDYHRSIVAVFDPSDNKLKHNDSMHALLEESRGFSVTDETLDQYLVHGGSLYYHPRPVTVKALRVFGYRLPVEMVDDTDEPDGIPVHLRSRLLVNYACRECFKMIEQGLEGAVPDVVKHDRFFRAALDDLERFVGPEDKPASFVDDDGDYIG